MASVGPKSFKTFAAPHEDTDKGWVWVSLGKTLASRTSIRITREFDGRRRSVYCEYREIDANFVKTYDGNENTVCMYFAGRVAANQARRKDIDLTKLGDIAVISEWCRNALGGFETTRRGGGCQKLYFDEPWPQWWRDLRAACQHPEPGVRVASKIAILGTWLGVTALLLAALDADPLKVWLVGHCVAYPTLAASCLSAIFGALCIGAGWGVVHAPRDDVR
jgi:hypothetical protein